MSRLIAHTLYIVNHPSAPYQERLGHRLHATPYAAIKACLDSQEGATPTHVQINTANGSHVNAEFSPLECWGTDEAFETRIKNQILAYEIQLNLTVGRDQVVDNLIFMALETQKMKA